jgi:hypothetical protein
VIAAIAVIARNRESSQSFTCFQAHEVLMARKDLRGLNAEC